MLQPAALPRQGQYLCFYPGKQNSQYRLFGMIHSLPTPPSGLVTAQGPMPSVAPFHVPFQHQTPAWGDPTDFCWGATAVPWSLLAVAVSSPVPTVTALNPYHLTLSGHLSPSPQPVLLHHAQDTVGTPLVTKWTDPSFSEFPSD